MKASFIIILLLILIQLSNRNILNTINVRSDANGGTISVNGSVAVIIKVAAGSKIDGINTGVYFPGNNTYCVSYLNS